MRTRCPVCGTVFRVTTEQLRLRAGKVRCGHCQVVFNAFDALVSEDHEPLIETPSIEEHVVEETLPCEEPALPEPDVSLVEPEVDAPVVISNAPLADWTEDLPGEAINESLPNDIPPSDQTEQPVHAVPEDFSPVAAEPHAEEPATAEEELIQEPLAEPLLESPEESTEAARLAGLVASRELPDTASSNRWSAGTLASNGLGGFDNESNQRAVWPFVLVAALLLIGLLGQLLFYFRTDISLRFPGTVGLYEFAGVDIPLPRNSALVSIETSDLQSDNARGLFVLQATLKNRAGYAQAWPALELSLTDTNDAVVSRRVMYAADYLPPGTTSDAFPANGEMAVKLWVEAKESGASGYRLYIFYP
ncbi:MAG: DUF3426 domain-containing protein [Azonexaceae bacterium]|nr:DUF3426 domain-containing protein [Azonexaceae bacterium]